MNHAIKIREIFQLFIHVFMYGNEQFSYETCHLVYLVLALNFQISFQSHIMLCLSGIAESEVSD